MQQKIQELTANIQLQQAEIQTLSNQYQACEGKYQQELTRLSGAKAQ
jgi:prefoldin subunit 5